MSKRLDGKGMERLLQALGDETRLRLLNLMKDEEVCVCFFVGALDALQPKVSRHLAYLRRVGLVAARRDGKWMHYSYVEPEDPHAAGIVKEALAWAAEDPKMHKDRERYKAACCGMPALVRLGAASRRAKREPAAASDTAAAR